MLNRILVAFCLIPPVAYIVFKGELLALIALQVAIAIMMKEFYDIIEKSGTKVNRNSGIFIGVFLPLLFYLKYPLYIKRETFSLGLIAITTIALMAKRILDSSIKKAIEHVSYTIFGIVYISFLMTHLILILQLNSSTLYILGLKTDTSRALLLLTLLLTFTSDSAAYFVGKSFGKKKLAPKISPKKTIAGAMGSIFVCMFVAFVFDILFLKISIVKALFIGLIASFFSQLGDLGASLFKREYNVKDSSTLLMEHGGLLDRCDSLLFSAPFLYYAFSFFYR